MDVVDRIKMLCKKNGTTISKLEKELGFGNGSIAKARDMTAKRLNEVAKHFGVSINYLLTGEDLLEVRIDPFFATLIQKYVEADPVTQSNVRLLLKMPEEEQQEKREA